jgi:hypothetical protein
MKYSILFIGFLFLTISISSQAQPVRDGVTIKTDSTSLTIANLKHPTFLQPTISTDSFINVNSPKPVHINTVAKTFLKIGSGLIRGDNENYPAYSLEKAWKYPGPTVRYPETATQYELFISRFNRYNPNGN